MVSQKTVNELSLIIVVDVPKTTLFQHTWHLKLVYCGERYNDRLVFMELLDSSSPSRLIFVPERTDAGTECCSENVFTYRLFSPLYCLKHSWKCLAPTCFLLNMC